MKKLFLLLVFAFLVHSGKSENIEPIECLINKSPIILEGELLNYNSLYSGAVISRSIHAIKVKKVLKGNVEKGENEIIYIMTALIYPFDKAPKPGTRKIYFIERLNNETSDFAINGIKKMGIMYTTTDSWFSVLDSEDILVGSIENIITRQAR